MPAAKMGLGCGSDRNVGPDSKPVAMTALMPAIKAHNIPQMKDAQGRNQMDLAGAF
jgi:hypothetical protein